jgi:putative SOS response-associated peptidase YedK
MVDDGQMIMAGLRATWKDPTSGNEIQNCTILTTDTA